MAREKLYKRITNKHLKILLGIIFILVSIYGLINFTFASTAAVYGMTYLFGNLYFVPFAIVIYFGFTLIYKPLFKKVKKAFVILGSIFLILALSMALTFCISLTDAEGAVITSNELTFANFYDHFYSTLDYNFNRPTVVFDINQGGGLLGYFLVASLNSLTTSPIGTMVICAIFFFLALLFFLYFPIKALVVYLKDDSDTKMKKFKKAKKVKKEVVVVEPVEEIVEEEEQIEEDLGEFVADDKSIIPNLYNEQSKDNNRIIPNDDSGFIKPSFDIFGLVSKEYEQPVPEQKVEKDIPQPEPVVTPTPVEKNPYEYTQENTIENDYEEDFFKEEPEETIKTPANPYKNVNNFNDFEIYNNPEPPVSKPVAQAPAEQNPYSNLTQREIISDINVGKNIFTGSVVINQSANRHYEYPTADLLSDIDLDVDAVEENKRVSEERLENINRIFEELGVGAKATGYAIGPAVTRFDIFPNSNVSVSSIEKYVNDVASRLGGVSARFEKIVEGKMGSSLEIPNVRSTSVSFKESFLALPPRAKGGNFIVPFGKAIDGTNINANFIKFPHLLVSGTTGSGKSVYLNSLLTTLIMRNSPDELKLLIIDPKTVEFSRFNGIPHLLGPVISQIESVKIALERLAQEMDNRYAFMNQYDYNDISDFNAEAEMKGMPKLPRIVVILDEYADLIENDKTISNPVTRLAAKARASGIHLIIATQRPSTNCITGTIKSNIATRVAFMAASNVDSRVIFDQSGAESLVGNGDMLVLSKQISRNNLIRAQGYFISPIDIKNVLSFLKSRYQPEYDKNFTNFNLIDTLSNHSREQNATSYNNMNTEIDDILYPSVCEKAYESEYMSISLITRIFSVGFSRAGKLFNQLVKDGIIGTEDIAGRGRKVLIHSDEELTDLKKEASDLESEEEMY